MLLLKWIWSSDASFFEKITQTFSYFFDQYFAMFGISTRYLDPGTKFITYLIYVIFPLLILIFLGWLIFYKIPKKIKISKQKEEIRRQEEEKRFKEEEARQQEEEVANLAETLYKKAKSRDVLTYNEETKEIITLIARTLGIADAEVEYYYNHGRNVVDAKEQEKIEEKHKKEVKCLHNQYNENKEKAEIIGYDKYTQGYKREIEKIELFEAMAKLRYDNAQMTLRQQTPNSDWATWGGLAEGIAGPAAGLAVAADVQRRNERERQALSERKEMARETIEETRKHMNQTVEKNMLKRKIERIEDKLIDIGNESQKFQKLSCVIDNAEYFDEEIIKVKLSINLAEDITLVNKPAVLDGTLRICIYDNDVLIGDGYYCAPGAETWPAVGFSKAIAEEVCCVPAEGKKFEEVTYKYVVEPAHLWIIED